MHQWLKHFNHKAVLKEFPYKWWLLNVRLKLEYEGDLGFSYMVDVNNETKEVEDIYMVCYLSSATDLPLFVSNNELRIKNDEQLKINLYDIDKGFIDINFKI